MCARFEDVERSKKAHQCRARRQSRSWRQKAWRRSRSLASTLEDHYFFVSQNLGSDIVVRHQSTCSNIKSRMDSQVCSKGHQGSSVDRPCQPAFKFWIKFWHVRNPLPQSIRIRLSVFVRYWTARARESGVYPKRPQMKKKPTHLSLLYDHCLATQHPSVSNTAANRGGNGNHSRGGEGPVRKDISPEKKKTRRRKPSVSRFQSPPHGEPP